MAQNKTAEGQFRGAVLTKIHVLGLLVEAGEATRGEHTNSARKVWTRTDKPSCSEDTREKKIPSVSLIYLNLTNHKVLTFKVDTVISLQIKPSEPTASGRQ